MGHALADHLLTFFRHYPAPAYLIGYSGGMDSHVLLHACSRLQPQLPDLPFRALHIDHGLQPAAAQWAQHCHEVCQQLGVPLLTERLQLAVPAGESVEAAARDARYAAFSRHLQAGEILLTAHHQHDQAETLLLHLLRGSGVDGLAAMPLFRPLAQGGLGRPLLACGRAELLDYAEHHRLDYIDDPSNLDRRFDRNFLRHQVMPVLQQRWPSAQKTLARAARLQAESRGLLSAFLQGKLAEMRGRRPGTLSISRLLGQETALQKALLREWLAERGLRAPEERRLLQVLHDVLLCAPDAMPRVQWEGCEIRRYRDDLYALTPLPPHDPAQVLAWDVRQPLSIPSLQRTLSPELLGSWREYLQASPEPVTVRFRQGGEKVWLRQRGGHHSLKKLLQEAGVAPWERERLPLVYVGTRLAIIAGLLHLEPDEYMEKQHGRD
ncbi:tRNA lysidine(34) synthetase TilS [Candidatus Thiothrix sp. Deng01]|uniref:tRNA(Ile)-lysidine synthase n=1 Tax=Candidatus Thiothrix phosphatis TaxID=3112415 RepID=A0ABU6D3E5_9GAMM|nr:tRNA lysidine(34) synthetase TilS [Candidatus Thiothrix sp. Deng01]MEB4592867.1 tRNA lysidine(34) synthetase TilS [Candidatus Thiothrix sp. Deng01]